MQPERSPRGEGTANPRLERLALTARAILIFERAWRIVLPPLVVLGAFVCVSWTGIWLDAPHWARAFGVFALVLGLATALLPLRQFRLPSRKEAHRADRPCVWPCIASGRGARRPPRQWDKRSSDSDAVEPASPPRGTSRGLAPHRRALAAHGRSRSLCFARCRSGRAYRDRLCRGSRKICARRRGFRLALRHVTGQRVQARCLDRSASLYRQATNRT